MTTPSFTSQDGKAQSIKKTFSRQTSVQIRIQADAAIIWALLTDASDFPRWNSTVTSLHGEIRLGGTLLLKSILDEKRTFKIKVKEFEAGSRMVWGDNMGNRVFTLSHQPDGRVLFDMTEKIGSPFFPLFSRFIPDFTESFEQYAADLKREAELISEGKG